MKEQSISTSVWAATALVIALCSAGSVSAQVAGGTTTLGVSVTESTQLAMGWSVKKTLLSKTVYNEAGDKVGKVEDLIVSPDKFISYVIVDAGGFVGIGRHDVAIPVAQIQNQAGKLILPGATKDLIKAMPPFDYPTDMGNRTAARDQFVAAADADIARAEAKLAELKSAAASKWRSFEAGVSAATARLRKSLS